MLSFFMSRAEREEKNTLREGDLYREVNIHGKHFTLHYGYYADCDRENPLASPIPIYPDFIEEPQYTDDGLAFVTMMQDACQHFDGKIGADNDCSECAYFRRCEELFGICTCQAKRIQPMRNQPNEEHKMEAINEN